MSYPTQTLWACASLSALCACGAMDSTTDAAEVSPTEPSAAEISEAGAATMRDFTRAMPRLSVASHVVLETRGQKLFASSVTSDYPIRGTADISLGLRSTDERVVRRAGTDVRVTARLNGASPVRAEVTTNRALFLAGGPQGSDLLTQVSAHSVEDFFRVTHPELQEISYQLDVSAVSGLRFVNATVEFLDADGSPQLRIARPYLIDGLGRHRWLDVRLEGCAYDTDQRVPWNRPVTHPGGSECTLRIQWQPKNLVFPIVIDPDMGSTFNLSHPRVAHTATLTRIPGLKHEGVCVVGGRNADTTLESVECFDRASEGWTVVAPMHRARYGHTTNVTGGGEYLLSIGGKQREGVTSTPLRSVERLNLATGVWTELKTLRLPRMGHTATTYPADGSVLVVGGGDNETIRFSDEGTAKPTASFPVPLFGHTASLVGDYVYVIGGVSSGTVSVGGALIDNWHQQPGLKAVYRYNLAEVENPEWEPMEPMLRSRVAHTATTLPAAGGGPRILVVGGNLEPEVYYVPTASAPGGRWEKTAGSSNRRRLSHAAVLFSPGSDDERVVVIGGIFGSAVFNSFEFYNPASGDWIEPGVSLVDARRDHTATLLDDGRSVLVVGGFQTSVGGIVDSTTEITPLSGLGENCQKNIECLSLFCVDGICCDGACEMPCATCKKASGAAKDGRCSAGLAGEDCGKADACHLVRTCDGRTKDCPSSAPASDGLSCRLASGLGRCVQGNCERNESVRDAGDLGPVDAGSPTVRRDPDSPLPPDTPEPASVRKRNPLACATAPREDLWIGGASWRWVILLVAAWSIRRRMK